MEYASVCLMFPLFSTLTTSHTSAASVTPWPGPPPLNPSVTSSEGKRRAIQKNPNVSLRFVTLGILGFCSLKHFLHIYAYLYFFMYI